MLARIDTANRSFISLLALVIAAALVAGLIGCCVIGVVLYRFGNDGLNAVDKPGTVPALFLLGLGHAEVHVDRVDLAYRREKHLRPGDEAAFALQRARSLWGFDGLGDEG